MAVKLCSMGGQLSPWVGAALPLGQCGYLITETGEIPADVSEKQF